MILTWVSWVISLDQPIEILYARKRLGLIVQLSAKPLIISVQVRRWLTSEVTKIRLLVLEPRRT